MKRLFFCTLICVIVCSAAYSQKVLYTKRTRNDVREGPGAYYNLVCSLPAGVAVKIKKREGNWVNISTVDKQTGWLSNNCLVAQLPKTEEIKDLSKELTSPENSKVAVAAAIRGFAEHYGNAADGDPEFLKTATDAQFSVDDYTSFISSTFEELSPVPLDKLGSIALMLREYEMTTAEEGIGAGVASRVAAKGIEKNPSRLAYLNMLGTYLLESTPDDDVQFHFYVLIDPKMNAFSIPGGYIFITQGMLDACENEAQLAGVLSHELAHIILRHGVKEIRQRTMLMKMEKYVTDLTKNLNDEMKETNKALEVYSSDVWDIVNKPRTIVFEKEADELAAGMLAHAGYDPNALLGLIKKMEQDSKSSLTKNYDQQKTFSFMDFKQRKEHLQQVLQSTLAKVQGKLNIERFKENIKQ